MNYQIIYNSPVGKLKLVSDGNYLIGLHFSRDQHKSVPAVNQKDVNPFPEVIRQT
jgi:hypothetical protein